MRPEPDIDPDTEPDILPKELRALRKFEQELAPTRGRGRLPHLRRLRPVPPMLDDVHLPVWDWSRPAPPECDPITLDVTAQWPSAASSARYPHGALRRRAGEQAFDGLPGFWLCDLRGITWRRGGDLMSPLGTNAHRPKVWLATPTVALLRELVEDEDAHWPDFPILDSWTSDEPVRFNAWTNWIRDTRVELMEAGADDLLAAFKDSYAIAVVMWKTGEGCDTKRPDWYWITLAQAAASHWRRLWNAVKAGHGPISAGAVDECVFTADDLTALMELGPLAPFRIDPTGRALGTYKIKKWL